MRSAEAIASGLGRGRLRGAQVGHPYHGVVSFGSGEGGDLHALYREAEPLLLDGRFYSHRTAARLWGIPLPASSSGEPLDIAVFDPRTPPRRAGIRGWRVSSVELRLLHGFPVVAPGDAWCQLGALLTRHDLVAAGDALLGSRRRPGLVALDELADAVARFAGKRGAAALGWALPRLRTGVDSRPESLLRLLLVRHRFGEPVVAFPVDVGDRVLHPDLSYPDRRVALEYEGDGHRVDRATWHRDIHRMESLADAGWRVLRVTSHDLFVDHAGLLGRVRRAMRSPMLAPMPR
jgi:very-short-patch-repair endonuclease